MEKNSKEKNLKDTKSIKNNGSELINLNTNPQGIAIITLNDPDTRNAMSEAMAECFLGVIEALKESPTIRAVILTGSGKAFSGGGHLEMLEAKTKISTAKNQLLMEKFYDSFLSILQLPVPVIAAINGHAMGAGLCLALACDMRVAVNDAKLGFNFVNLGLHPGMGVTYFLPRLVGPASAAELLYCGRILETSEALSLGIVNRVVKAEELMPTVFEIAGVIAAAGPQSIRELRTSLNSSLHLTLEECLRREAVCQSLDYVGPEFMEGIRAAREKRKPTF